MLSIITNFGCNEGCDYCIWKNHKLSKCKTSITTTNWQDLKQAIKGQPRISISGGGDPLFNLKNNLDWWERLYSIKSIKTGKTIIDLHTAKIASKNFLERFKINKYVFHLKNPNDLHQINELMLLPFNKLRIVLVADKKYTEHDYMMLAKELLPYNIQFSIRQKVVNNEAIEIMTDFLKKEISWKYIKQGDYNTYFMPNNKVYDKFLI